MKIAVLTQRLVLGDVLGNARAIVAAAELAKSAGADVLLTPELALTGGLPEDALLSPDFFRLVHQGLDEILELDDITVVVGHPVRQGAECFNAATVYRDGNRLAHYQKMTLNNSGIQDECRYFTPGAAPAVFEQNGIAIGLLMGEDLNAGSALLLVLSAAPFMLETTAERARLAAYRVEETACPLIYANACGGVGELVYDGASFALNQHGQIMAQAPVLDLALPSLAAPFLLVDYADGDIQAGVCAPVLSDLVAVSQALILGIRDFACAQGLSRAVMVADGQVKTALVLALAKAALGAENVTQVASSTAQTTVHEAYVAALGEAAPSLEAVQVELVGRIARASGCLFLDARSKTDMIFNRGLSPLDLVGVYAPLKDIYDSAIAHLMAQLGLSCEAVNAEQHAKTEQTDVMLHALLEHASLDELKRAAYAQADILALQQALALCDARAARLPLGLALSTAALGRARRMPAVPLVATR
jgi:predicted amidohydrolase